MRVIKVCVLLSLAIPLIGSAAEPDANLVNGYRNFDCQTLTTFRVQQEARHLAQDAQLRSNMSAVEPQYRTAPLAEWEKKKDTQRASFDLVYKEKQCSTGK